jgi:3-methyl-2-oxobutanoate hydroxymethyltransferase
MTPRRLTVPAFRDAKGKRKLVCLTAYDVLTAQILDEAGVDLILVGDSLGNVILGHETTLPVTLDDMVRHSSAVMRARPRAPVVADMPFLTYHVSPEDSVRNAGRLVQEAGVDGVKLEGGRERVPHIRAIREAEIPVMGHLGLTPQSVLEFGGYRVQGREPEAARRLREDARLLEGAGCFAIVLEGVPGGLAAEITKGVSIPTVGIGAGAACDGQILVVSDLLGLPRETPRFVRRYADLRSVIGDAVKRYADDVREGRFPGPDESYGE